MSDGVGTVTQFSTDANGVPVIALDERHNSRVGQLQHAITLVRLYDKFGLKDIVLEGYLKESSKFNTDWFTKAVAGKTPEARAKVAVQFLKHGDISAAEFMKLVYPDITLHAAEASETYHVEPPANFAVIDYLQAIVKVDPAWAVEKSKPYQSLESFQALSGDEKLGRAKEIKQYVEDNSISVSPKIRQSMQQYITFMEKRMASNITINDTVKMVSSSSSPKVIAINIGEDHTHNMCQLLKQANHPYAVVTPRYGSPNKEHGNLTDTMYDRKNKKLPVFSQGLSALILQEVSGGKKPEPVLAEHWFEAEAEFHAYVTSLAEGVLGPPTPPDEKAPFGFSNDDFRGKWISIVLADAEYLPDQDDRRRAILIPVKFNRSGKVVWVGATLQRGMESNQVTVEAILTQGLQDIQAEKKTPESAEQDIKTEGKPPKPAKGKIGSIQMSSTTFAIVGNNKEAIKRAITIES
ncbi:MAG TPA: hypothetical protein VK892_16250 [Pyrinomonadaceae bacterium]|nr:hypothetical protein [Pyrinomonadaceae bacterium]